MPRRVQLDPPFAVHRHAHCAALLRRRPVSSLRLDFALVLGTRTSTLSLGRRRRDRCAGAATTTAATAAAAATTTAATTAAAAFAAFAALAALGGASVVRRVHLKQAGCEGTRAVQARACEDRKTTQAYAPHRRSG